VKLTSSLLRRIIAEEVAAVAEAAPPHLMTPEEEIALASKSGRGSFAEFEAGFQKRARDRRWADLSSKFPKATKRVGRGAFEEEHARREEGAAGGGSHLTPADEYRILLHLLEDIL
jgi:hypothetical protein